jgi:hypothetical protein
MPRPFVLFALFRQWQPELLPSVLQRMPSIQPQYTLFIVATNRDIFLEECINSFRKHYPLVEIVLVDNSGSGAFAAAAGRLGVRLHQNDSVRSVSENQNWVLDNAATKYFVFSADDIAFLKPGFLEESAQLHDQGYELVSLGVDDPCAFSMVSRIAPRIGRFNVQLLGKERTDLDILARCQAIYGFLPSVGGYWRETPDAWESKYIKHYRFKPDVNQFLKERGMRETQIMNESKLHTVSRLVAILRERASVTLGGMWLEFRNRTVHKGLPPPVHEILHQLPRLPWKKACLLSIGQVPRHAFWPARLAAQLGAPNLLSKHIVEKCEAYKPHLEAKFTPQLGFTIHADDVLNVAALFEPKSMDLAVWYDGPEHLEKNKALEALKKLELVTSGLILISTPLGFLPQGADGSYKKIQNPYNTHLSGWTTAELEGLGYQTHVCRKSIPSIVAWKQVG